jgi:osmotically inducible protein OsmC
MTKIENVLLTGKTRTTVAHKDGRVDIALSTPGKEAKPVHLFEGIQSHPTAEQFFAGAWSACYIAAIGLVAQDKKVQLPSDLSVEIEVDLGMTGQAYFIQARFVVTVPGVPQDVAEAIAHAAHDICPYSKATHGNIDVAMTVIAG